MKMLTVSLTLNTDQFARVMEILPADIGLTIYVHEDEPAPDEVHAAPAPKAKAKPKRAPRGSKVEAAIRNSLANGARATTKFLKSDLERVGLKPSSLGATLSKMQRNGEVTRNAGGDWSLTERDMPIAAQ